MADLIEASGLDYTIIRQRGLLNVDEVNYELTRKGEPEMASDFSKKHYNKSITTFISKIVESP